MARATRRGWRRCWARPPDGTRRRRPRPFVSTKPCSFSAPIRAACASPGSLTSFCSSLATASRGWKLAAPTSERLKRPHLGHSRHLAQGSFQPRGRRRPGGSPFAPHRYRLDRYDEIATLGPVLARILPLFAEDWPVEAPHAPFASGSPPRPRRTTDLTWLLEQLAALPLSAVERSQVYGSLDLPLKWDIGNSPVSRSRLRLPGRKLFVHREPLIRRADVSIARELASSPLPVLRLARPEARRYSVSFSTRPRCAIGSCTASAIRMTAQSITRISGAASSSSSSASRRVALAVPRLSCRHVL